MIGSRTVARHGYDLAVGALLAGILVVSGFLVLVALPDLGGLPAFLAGAPTPTPSPSASPSASPGSAMSPIGIEMAPDSDCAACHVTTAGTVGTREIPDLAHPLWGWRNCTACHANDSLVKTAPGHTGLHRDECLVCHRAPVDTSVNSHAPLRPEHMGGTQACTSCHGVDEHAPLPESMEGRDNCWICHNGPEFTYLFESPAATPTVPSPTVPSPTPTG
jgi:hypothetical protein